MGNVIKDRISSLTDEELEQCFNDIVEYNKTGAMGDTFVRRMRDEIAIKLEYDSWDVSCNMILIPEILYEIAKRHYHYEGK